MSKRCGGVRVSNNKHKQKQNEQVAVAEIYSPPRVSRLACEFGFVPGFALDLAVVDPDDGKQWDFNDSSKRSKALKLLDLLKPKL